MSRRFTCFFVLPAVLFFCAGCQSQKPEETAAQTAAPAAQKPSGEVTYTVPEGWVAQPPSSQMRKAEFALPGVEGKEAAELAVFFFPGMGGSVEANLERWYGQFEQSDGSATKHRAQSQQLEVNGLAVTVVSVAGTYLKSSSPMMMGGPTEKLPDYAMLAAIVETGGGPWFFKAVGPQATIAHWRPSFDAFVRSFKIAQ